MSAIASTYTCLLVGPKRKCGNAPAISGAGGRPDVPPTAAPDPLRKLVSVLEASPLDHTNTFPAPRRWCPCRHGRDLAMLAIQDSERSRQPGRDLTGSSDCKHIQSKSFRVVA